MRILFLTISGRKGASSRYRVYQYIPFFEEAGHKVVVMPPADGKGRGLGRLFRGITEERSFIDAVRGADVVFIQKRLFRRGFIDKLRRLGKKMVFDFDDSVFTSPKGDWSAGTRRRVLGRLKAVLEASDLVVAGNAFLGTYAAKAGASRLEVLPTAVETEKYMPKEHRGGTVVLGWIGSSVNHSYLDTLSGVLPAIAKEFPGLKLLVVSDKDYAMEGVTVENRRWSEGTEAADLLGMDIGLMPLADNDWTRGKCALKALQYMACGIPAVCSPVGANNEVVEDGVDGCLPVDEGGWVTAIRSLVSSPELRDSMGQAGRKKVIEQYSVAVLAPRYVRLVESLWA